MVFGLMNLKCESCDEPISVCAGCGVAFKRKLVMYCVEMTSPDDGTTENAHYCTAKCYIEDTGVKTIAW